MGGPAKWPIIEAAAKRKPGRAQHKKKRCTKYGLAGGPDAT